MLNDSAQTRDGPVAATLGKYRLITKLGQGGMADVFLAVGEGPGMFNKLVVVKRHRDLAEADTLLAMFLDEAKLAAQLNHRNIVHTYEVGEERGAYFIVMEYLEGQPLNRVLGAARREERGTDRLTEAIWLHVVDEILSGLHYVHEATDYGGTALGIVHRDMSPHNVFVTYDGAVKIIDFGIAKAALNTTGTETGVLKGRAAYMAPEQATGSKTLDRRADIFAVGIMVWEMVAKRRLLGGDTLANLRRLVSDEPMPRLSTTVPGVPPELDTLVARALEHDPDKRFQSAGEMREALLYVLHAHGSGAISAEDVAARMLGVFAEERAEMRDKVKRFLDERCPLSVVASVRASVPTGLPMIYDTVGSEGDTRRSGVSRRHRGHGHGPDILRSHGPPAPGQRVDLLPPPGDSHVRQSGLPEAR
jgi:serine/threonine protein kinase